MAEIIHNQEIEKVHRNLFRMAEYFTERRKWKLSYDADGPLKKLQGQVANLQSRVRSLRSSAADDGQELPKLGWDPIPAASFDGQKLNGFATYLEDLDRWFTTRSGFEDEARHGLVLTAIDASLEALGEATQSLWSENHVDDRPSVPETATSAPAPPPVREDSGGHVEHIARPAIPLGGTEPEEDVEPIANLMLKLENTVERPLLQEFQGRVELTFEAKEEIQAFLVKARAEMPESDQRRFEEKVLRWIEGTPEGQILILKSGAMDGPFKLYPIYRHRDDVGDLQEEPS